MLLNCPLTKVDVGKGNFRQKKYKGVEIWRSKIHIWEKV